MNLLEIDDLADVVAQAIDEATDPLLARIDALEKQVKGIKSVSWAGVNQKHVRYQEGQLCTHSGSLWLAQRETEDLPGSPDSGWRLVVKEGSFREQR